MMVSIFYAYQYILRVMPNTDHESVLPHQHKFWPVFWYLLHRLLTHIPMGIFLDLLIATDSFAVIFRGVQND
jgi:hypothetical protein